MRYLSFVTDDLKSNKNLVMNEKETRDLFERSLEQRNVALFFFFLEFLCATPPKMPCLVGAHMAEGSLLWMMYIMFEAVYAKDKYTAIQQLYRRELAIPHLSFDETLAGYAQNEMDNDPAGKDAQLASLKATIESSKKGTDKRRPFEDALVWSCREQGGPLKTYSNTRRTTQTMTSPAQMFPPTSSTLPSKPSKSP